MYKPPSNPTHPPQKKPLFLRPNRPFHPRLSHISWRDLWQPSPRQRVINAVRTGSRELGFRQHRHETLDDLALLHRAAVAPPMVPIGARELR